MKGIAFLCVVFGVSCVSHGPSLRSRSAGDMHCSAQQLLIYHLDERSYRVVVCGPEFVYVSSCEDPDAKSDSCTWILNSHAEPASDAAPGCSSDSQCKGDRICVHKECVAPPPTAP